MGSPSLWGESVLLVALWICGACRISVPRLPGQNWGDKLGSEGSHGLGEGRGEWGAVGHSWGPVLKQWPQVKEEGTGWDTRELGCSPEPPLPCDLGNSSPPLGGGGSLEASAWARVCARARKSFWLCLFATLQAVAGQASVAMRFSRQEYWSGLLCPPPGDLPDPGIKPTSLMPPALAGGFFTTSATWEVHLESNPI